MSAEERTWTLSIRVTDYNVDKTMRVSGDQHIGGVMFKLVESLAVTNDWSDHALWWPEKNIWLNKPRATLNQYGVQAEAKLAFTPMHKSMEIMLPDLQIITAHIDFSINVFNAVMLLCKEKGIRYPEEISLLRPQDKSGKDKQDKKAITPSAPNNLSNRNSRASSSSNGSLNKGVSNAPSPYHTPVRTPSHIASPMNTTVKTPATPGTPGSWINGMSPAAFQRSITFDESEYYKLINSLHVPAKEAFLYLHKPKCLLDKAMINGGWMDSNKSLMEQGVSEKEILHLRFKYYSFYDLNPKYDPVRINQIYEQAKWSLISEELDCTEEEMMMFAALQLQIQQQATQMREDELDGPQNGDQDDIDAALTDLQVSLEGSSLHNGSDITQVPELQEYIKHFRPRKYTIKGAKRLYATLRDTQISLFKSKEESNGQPLHQICLRGAEIQPDVNLTQQKYVIRVLVPGAAGLSEEWLKCDNEEQYARWMAACKLGSKGQTMADSSYNAEVKNIEQFLSLQKPSAPFKPSKPINPNEATFDPADYVAPRFLKKSKTKVIQRIIDASANVRDMTLSDAKMSYIKAWQALPEYGLSYFLVKFRNSKKEEIIGVGFNRLIRLNPKTAEVTRTYRFSTMRSWSVHWENREVIVDFEEEKLAFKSLSADCKVLHEVIGGYIFLSMRSQEKTQTLNEDLFQKLTSGLCS